MATAATSRRDIKLQTRHRGRNSTGEVGCGASRVRMAIGTVCVKGYVYNLCCELNAGPRLRLVAAPVWEDGDSCIPVAATDRLRVLTHKAGLYALLRAIRVLHLCDDAVDHTEERKMKEDPRRWTCL